MLISENNASAGMFVGRNATVRVQGTGSGLPINDNGSTGLLLFKNSVLDLINTATPASIAIRNNGGIGLDVDDGSSAEVSGGTISGNTGGDIRASFGSRLELNGTLNVGALPIVCDASVLSRGTSAIRCP